jgi:hypothetical protein
MSDCIHIWYLSSNNLGICWKCRAVKQFPSVPWEQFKTMRADRYPGLFASPAQVRKEAKLGKARMERSGNGG